MLLPVWFFWALAALADVAVLKPAAGKSFSALGGSALVEVTWMEDGGALKLEDLKLQSVLLCSGSNANIKCYELELVEGKSDLTDKDGDGEFKALIKSSQGPNGNYFFQVFTLYKDGLQLMVYLNRFALTGMEGTARTGWDYKATGPPPARQAQSKDGGAGAPIDLKSFLLHYTEQTGPTKYAPMQMQPGLVVTATTYTRRYELLLVLAFLTKGPEPKVMTTITPGWLYTPESATNWASPADFPTVYYPALERVTRATAAPTNKKRWL